ncbi:MAG: hypothetical protein GTO14_12780 [Anaerolineales bacterium]|nr:hypothetical protein [Anaerolineales bacterium]
MKKQWMNVFAIAFTLGLLVTGCGASQPRSPIAPAPDKPTFLYFYTDG